MKKLLAALVVAALVLGLCTQVGEAAKWKYHYWLSNTTTLTVYGTVNCQTVGPPLFQGTGVRCNEASGWLPAWCNDYMTILDWKPGYTCGNVDTNKVTVKYHDGSYWKLRPLGQWIDYYVSDSVALPTVGDSTGNIQRVHVVVDLTEWLADARAPQDTYVVVNGECDDLPGYTISTTAITFDSTVGPGQNPFQTTPLTGTLYWDGAVIFEPVRGPTLTEWGLIVFAGLFILTLIYVLRKRKGAILRSSA